MAGLAVESGLRAEVPSPRWGGTACRGAFARWGSTACRDAFARWGGTACRLGQREGCAQRNPTHVSPDCGGSALCAEMPLPRWGGTVCRLHPTGHSPAPSDKKLRAAQPHRRGSDASPGPSGGVMRRKVRRPMHPVSLPMQNVTQPIHNVRLPTRKVRRPMHHYRHPMHNVRHPIHFIAIRLGFCAFARLECPVLGQNVSKRDTV